MIAFARQDAMSDDFPLDPFIEERRFEEPPPQAAAALGKMLALWRSFAANGEIPVRYADPATVARPRHDL